MLMRSTAQRIIGHVADRTGVPASRITGRGRDREALNARKRTIRLLHRLRYSCCDIGYAVERDHTTILHHLGRLS